MNPQLLNLFVNTSTASAHQYSCFEAGKKRLSVWGLSKLPLCFAAMLTVLFTFYGKQSSAQGTWTAVTTPAPNANLGVMILLSDGTVMCKSNAGGADGYGNTWNKLTPNSSGSYINGTWSTLAPMANTRLYFASQVLKDGRVYVAGGEYGTGLQQAETYNPLTNTWTPAPSPGQNISDANSEILPDGRVLQALVAGNLKITTIWNPVTNTYSAGPSCLGIHNESAWVKLPDNSILFVDRLSTASERYIPATNTWINDGTVPVALYDPFGFETGGATLLPDGRAWFIGSLGHTAYYTPSGSTAMGSWAAGPDVPLAKGTPDAPLAMMVNGKILCSVSPVPTSANHFPTPTTFYEFDYLTNTFTSIVAPGGAASINVSCYVTNFLDLPDGTVLYSRQNSSQYYVYTPSGSPLAAGKPVINNITSINCTTYSITGTQFNGISQGANYGDDWQMSTNYPLVRLTSGANVYYARTSNWNSTGLRRGALPDTAQFVLPAGLPQGTYNLVVVANGIASNPVSFTTGLSPTISGSLSFCAGSSTTLNAGAGYSVYSWSTGATTQTINANTSGVFTVTVTGAGGCTGSTSANLIVNPLPTVSFAGLAASYNISAAAATLTGSPVGGTFSGPGISGNTFTPSFAGVGGPYTIIYSYTDGNGCSNSSSQQTTVTNCTPPAKPSVITTAGGNTKVCPGDSKSYSINTVAGATSYSWTPPPGGVVASGQGTTSVTINYTIGFVATDSLKVAAVNACGTGIYRAIKISRNIIPAQPSVIAGSINGVCGATGVPYSVTNVAGLTYNWSNTNSNSTIVSGQGTSAITADYTNGYFSGNLEVTASNGCGAGTARKLTVKGVPGVITAMTGSSVVCANQQGVPYSISPIGSATNYTWVAPGGGRISDGLVTSTTATLVTTASSVTVNYKTTAGDLKVRANNSCGSTAYFKKAITFNCRGENGFEQGIDFSVVPNPNNGNFTLQFSSDGNQKTNISLVDALGQKFYSEEWTLNNGLNRKEFNMTDELPAGIYFVIINSENGAYRQKVVKQ